VLRKKRVQKYIPLSLVIVTIALPIALARRPNGKNALRTMHWMIAGYIVLWAYLCLYVYTQYVFIE
jgi:hypothetical protein